MNSTKITYAIITLMIVAVMFVITSPAKAQTPEVEQPQTIGNTVTIDLDTLSPELKEQLQKAQAVTKELSSTATDIVDGAKNVVDGAKDVVDSAGKVVDQAKDAANTVKEQTQKAANTVVDTMNNAADSAGKAVKKADEAAGGVVAEVSKALSPKNMDGYGQAFANTIKSTCDSLNVSVNEFVKSPVGILTLGAVAIKLVGPEVATGAIGKAYNLCLGVPVFLFGWMVLGFFIRHFFMQRRVWTYVGGKKDTKITEVYQFNNKGTREITGIVLIATSIIFTIMMLGVIF